MSNWSARPRGSDLILAPEAFKRVTVLRLNVTDGLAAWAAGAATRSSATKVTSTRLMFSTLAYAQRSVRFPATLRAGHRGRRDGVGSPRQRGKDGERAGRKARARGRRREPPLDRVGDRAGAARARRQAGVHLPGGADREVRPRAGRVDRLRSRR